MNCVALLCVAPIHTLTNRPAFSLVGVPVRLLSADSDREPGEEARPSVYLLHIPMHQCQEPEFLSCQCHLLSQQSLLIYPSEYLLNVC